MKPVIDGELIRQLCELARLDIQPAEEEHLREDLSRLVAFVSRLEEDSSDAFDFHNQDPLERRADKASAPRSDVLLSLSSRVQGRFVNIPKVVDAEDQ